MKHGILSLTLAGALVVAASCEKQPTALAAATPTTSLERAEAGRAVQGQRRPLRNPIARLIANADTLGLTTNQVAKLKSIQAALRTKNEPLLAKIRAARDGGGSREQRRARAKELAPVVKEIRANTRAAVAEAMSVLTAEQQAKLKELRQARQQQRQRHERRGA